MLREHLTAFETVTAPRQLSLKEQTAELAVCMEEYYRYFVRKYGDHWIYHQYIHNLQDGKQLKVVKVYSTALYQV